MDPICISPYGPAAIDGRIFEAGHTTAPDHMPNRDSENACIRRGVHTLPLRPTAYPAKLAAMSPAPDRRMITMTEYPRTLLSGPTRPKRTRRSASGGFEAADIILSSDRHSAEKALQRAKSREAAGKKWL
jgi:hypothetical protein